MRHLSDGVLRRIHDDPFAIANRQREHLDACARCSGRLRAVGADADRAARLFTATSATQGDPERSLASLRRRAAAGARPRIRIPGGAAPSRRWAIGALLAPVLAVALVATANAAGWLSVFSPTQVAPLTLTTGELTGLPDLSLYGRAHATQLSLTPVGDSAAAGRATGLRLLVPGWLPSGVPDRAAWAVAGRGTATFTLDPVAAAAHAARQHQPAVSIPPALQNTSITVTAGPAAVEWYGGSLDGSSPSSLPTLAVAQGVRPTATTNGATLSQLESFLLSQPGVSPQLAAEIRAIGQPASTLPIPVISGAMAAQSVTINGAPAVAEGDSTGLGALVIWEKSNIVYLVAGQLSMSDVIGVARSLH